MAFGGGGEDLWVSSILTETKDYHVYSDDGRLAVEQELGWVGAQCCWVHLVCSGRKLDPAEDDMGHKTYKPMGKNCEMPPRTMITATTRLTMRLRWSATS